MIKVNLLPPEIKKEISQTKKNKEIRSLIFRNILILLIAVAFSILAFFYFDSSLKEVSSQFSTKTEAIKNLGNIEEKAKNVSDRVTSIKKISAEIYIWSGIMEGIQKVVPAGIYLNSLKLDSNQNNRNQISGFAESKKDVAVLRDEMEKSDKFQYVDIEKSSTVNDPVLKREVENFTLSFSLEKGALK